jgi:eukaryotic-like serine/threonine-protein kinase
VLGLKAVNCQNGDILAQEQVQARSKEKVLDALGEAASKLRGELGESLATVHNFDVPLVEATTPSLDALKALTLGDAKHSTGDELGALPNYQRAVELDPNFAMAYARLGAVYSNLGQVQLSEQNRQKAFELRDRASEREKLYIMSHYYGDSGELDKGITALELYQQTYPRDSTPFSNLASVYNELGQFDKALPNAKQAVEIDPDSVVGYANLAKAYAGVNRVEEARATLNTALQHKVSTSDFHIALAKLDWAQGKDADMEKELQTASTTPDGALTVLSFRGDLASARGQLGKTRDFWRQLEDGMDRLHLQGRALIESSLATNEALAGNHGEAASEADEAVRLAGSFYALWNAGMAYGLRAGWTLRRSPAGSS